MFVATMINLLFANIPNESLGSVHFMVGMISALLFSAWGVILILSGYFKFRHIQDPGSPKRNLALRKGLGWSFILLCLIIILVSTFFNIHSEESAFYFPYTGLMLSIVQVFLFTVAILVLFNSKRLNKRMVLPNFIPLIMLPFSFVFLKDSGVALCVLGICFFAFYVLQLIIYTILFFRESSKALFYIEKCMDYDKSFHKDGSLDITMIYGISVLYLTSISVGIWIFSSYYFANISYDLTFMCSYTICYFLIGWHYLAHSSNKMH